MKKLISKTNRVRSTFSSCEAKIKKLYIKTSDTFVSLCPFKGTHKNTHNFLSYILYTYLGIHTIR